MIRASMQSRDPERRRKLDSFSLVEMLVAIAVLSIIMVLLAGMTGSLMTLWRGGQAHNERRTDTQAIFDRMSRDLQQMSVPAARYGNPALYNTNGLEMGINPSGVSTNFEFPQALFWQAPVANNGSTNGNLAIVGYCVQWVNGSPFLTRVLINPQTIPSSANYYTIYSSPSSWISDNVITNTAPATTNSGYQGLMSPNVLGVWFQCLDGMGNPIQQGSSIAGESFDSRLGYAYTNFLYTNSSGNPVITTYPPCALPAAIQVAIVIIDSATARHLTGTEKPMVNSTYLSGNFWNDVQYFYTNLPPIIRQGAEIQTTTVQISNGPR